MKVLPNETTGEHSHQSEANNGGELQPPSTVESLIPDVMETIFGQLDVRSKGRAAQVSVTWRDVLYLPSVWRGNHANLRLKHSDNHILLSNLARRDIRDVNIKSLEVDTLQELLRCLSRLEVLTLFDCGLPGICDLTLHRAFTTELPHLVNLTIVHCDSISDVGMAGVIQHCPNLVFLDLTGCRTLTDNCLHPVGNHLTKLRSLRLSYVPKIGDEGVEYITGLDPQVAGNLNIKALRLQGCEAVSNWAIQNIGGALSQLASLYLGGSDLLTDDTMVIISHMPSLRELVLESCPGVTDAGLGHLARMASLQALIFDSCNGFTDTGLALLVEGGSRIVELRLAFCKGVTNVGLYHVSYLSELCDLYLRDCPGVSDVGLALLAKWGSKLVRLTCFQCFNLSNLSMTFVARLAHLQQFRCFLCPIGNQSLVFLADGGSKLDRLDLASTEVTDVGIVELARMPTLRTLNLYGSQNNVSLAGLVELFNRGSTITNLNVDKHVKHAAMEADKLPFLGVAPNFNLHVMRCSV